MKKIALVVYLVAVHVALGVAVWRRPVQAMSPEVAVRITSANHARVDATVPDGAVIFIGDSITAGLVTAAVAPVSVNYGIGGQTSTQLLAAMDGYKSMARASAVAVMIGTNDLLAWQAKGLADRYSAILRKVPAGVPVILSSAPPIELASRPELKAQAADAALIARRACAADVRCVFVDAHAALARPGVLTGDGVHLEAEGYRLWIAPLRAALTRAARWQGARAN